MAKYFNCGGLKMPSIGLGTWQSNDETQLENALEAALEIGYRHIDTAFIYGNEHVIGRVLKKWFDAGKLKREDIFVTTKLPICGVHQDRIEMFINKSLANLQLDYLDLYLVHFPIGTKYVEGVPLFQLGEVEDPDHEAIWKKMEAQVKAGRTKTIGLSNFTKQQVQRILDVAKIPPASLQVEMHVFLQQDELVDFCHENGISVVAYSPLANPSYNLFLTQFGHEPKKIPDALNNSTVAAIAKKHNRTTAQVLLRFLLQRDVGVIPKSVSPERLRQNFEIYDFSLDEDDMEMLKELDQGEKGRISDWKIVFPGLEDHPEYPFK